MNWQQVEKIIGEPIPICIKTFLSVCAYNNLSLKYISPQSIVEIENHINTDHQAIIQDLGCCYSDYYKNQTVFKLLPGHKDFILGLSKANYQATNSNSPVDPPVQCLMLHELMKSGIQNIGKSKHGERYNDILKFFATYVFLMSGRASYEVLNKNLPLPSTKTILRCIDQNKTRVVEGQLRCRELSEFLDNLNVTKKVWLSEDATVITQKISYDPETNQLVGLVLPKNADGNPIPFSYTAKDAQTIEKCIKLKKSNYAYIVMAQAVDEKVPPFLLQMYGTDSTCKTQDIIKRWDVTKRELEKYGIELVGISSDGDPRLLSAMCYQMTLLYGITVTQDSVHIGGKLRNRMLRRDLKMGTKNVSINHLISLVKDVQKSVHGLSQMDVFPNDTMNSESYEKIIKDRVIEALQDNVQDSEGTIQYLKVCRNITSGYLELDMLPQCRIYNIWYGVYFLRIWREFINNSKTSTLFNHFITSNAYACAEINAKNLIVLIKKFRDENAPEQFTPNMFDSQTCEKTFRQFRSMGTTQYTKINFSIYELLHMIGRIEVMNDIAYNKLAKENIVFPNKRIEKTVIYELPNDHEINAILMKAKADAIKDGEQFGMTAENIEEYVFKSQYNVDSEDECLDGSDDEMFEQLLNDEDYYLENERSSDDENFFDDRIGPDSPLVVVKDDSGNKKIIRKSTLLWSLTEPSEKLSNDRLRRVQISTKKRRLNSNQY